ncbi:hypothetical protein ACKI1S_46745 [Streptomyces galilaeus]|uniref:Uncharacterized protein n=1 Tax=Streptomyces galilaeus TaxID=33899 RepID=A0ABW9IZX7_STRGJ
MIHHPHIVAEIRELPPEGGWARYESTGRACLVCSCGTVTGFVDKADVRRQAAEHPAAHTKVGIHLDPAEAEDIKARWRAQYGTPGAAHPVVPLDPQQTDGEVSCVPAQST